VVLGEVNERGDLVGARDVLAQPGQLADQRGAGCRTTGQPPGGADLSGSAQLQVRGSATRIARTWR
jgi:hypothetical protein